MALKPDLKKEGALKIVRLDPKTKEKLIKAQKIIKENSGLYVHHNALLDRAVDLLLNDVSSEQGDGGSE